MEHNAPAPIQGTAPLSTSIDVNAPSGPVGGGAAPLTEKAPDAKPESIGDTLRGELTKAREQEAKAEADKAKAEDKGEKAEDGKKPDEAKDAKGAKVEDDKAKAKEADAVKPAKGEKTEVQPEAGDKSAAPEKDDAGTGQDGDKARQSEGRKYHEPPARFLPEARAKWANVPNEVKAEFHRVSQEFEQEVGQYRESHEFRQKLSKFERMANQHNTTIADALEDYTAVDGLLTANPVEGIRQVLARVGITPEQYAQHVLKNPQAHQAPVSRAPDPVQQQTSPEIEALRAEVEALKRDKQVEQTAPIVQAFAAAHEDYHALEPQIAEILGTGVIEKLYGTGLSPEQKLAEAYRMAGGKGPSSRSEPPLAAAAHSNANDRPVDPAGQKSIRGAPNGGQEPNDDPPETDIRALLKKEFRKAV